MLGFHACVSSSLFILLCVFLASQTQERLTELLLESSFDLPQDMGTLTVSKVANLTGDCAITVMMI